MTKHSSATIDLQLDVPLCIELYRECKDLGRFLLRTNGRTVAAGIVLEIMNNI